MVEDVSHGPNKRQKFVGDGMEEESPEEKASRRLAELIVSSSAKDDDTLCQMVRGAGLKGSVIEGVGEAALEGMLARMREIKAADLRPGLLLAGQMIVRWSATEGVGEKQLGFLRRKSGIAVFSGFLRHLTKAEAQLQDIIQEDLLVASAESLGWLAGDEAGEGNQTDVDVVKAQCPEAAESLESSLRVFSKFKKFQVVGHGAMGWLRLHEENRRDLSFLPAH